MDRASLLLVLLAIGKFDPGDSRLPIKTAAPSQVLGSEPEGTVVCRIDTDTAVIAPTVWRLLRAFACGEFLLCSHLVGRIIHTPASVANGGRYLSARHTVAHGHVA